MAASRIITFKRGACWWSASEGAYPLSAALETIKVLIVTEN
ncbi:DUF6330 family protein [Sulfitobacter sp. 1A10445]